MNRIKKDPFYIMMFEEYINSIDNRINTLFVNMEDMFIKSFSDESPIFGEEDLGELYLVDSSVSQKADFFEKNIKLDFSDPEFCYGVIVVIKSEDVKDNEPITKCYMKISIYDNSKEKLLKEWQSDLEMETPKNNDTESDRFIVKVKEEDSELDNIENFIVFKISKLIEKIKIQ